MNRIVGKLATSLVGRLHSLPGMPRPVSVLSENFLATTRGKRVRFRYDKKTNLFKAVEGGQTCYFSDLNRGFWLYRNGIDARRDFIFASYCLQNMTFEDGDVVIDCGANSGDLFLKLKEHISPKNYICIEPNPSDFEILRLNVPTGCKIINMALGNIDGRLRFYVLTSSGDSSLIEPPRYDKVIDVDVVRLDNLINDLKFPKIKLLKIEAEGAEPEIL